MADSFDLTELQDRAAALVEAAKRAGADACDAVVAASRSTGVEVRDGAIEETEGAENNSFSLRAFVGDRSAAVQLCHFPIPLVSRDRPVSPLAPPGPR